MVTGEARRAIQGSLAEGKKFKAHCLEGSVKLFIEAVGKAQFAETGFHGELPGGNRADHGAGLKALYQAGSRVRELGGSFEEPDDRIGVEEQIHEGD